MKIVAFFQRDVQCGYFCNYRNEWWTKRNLYQPFFFLDHQQVAELGTSSPLPPLPLGWSRGKNHRKSENWVQITYDKWNDNLISLSIKKYFDYALSLKLFCWLCLLPSMICPVPCWSIHSRHDIVDRNRTFPFRPPKKSITIRLKLAGKLILVNTTCWKVDE